jgi:uncharacterized damage-inducible protein DinB
VSHTRSSENNPPASEPGAGPSANAVSAEVRPPEPWLRGSLAGVPMLTRAVLHALELAGEDVQRWCASLTDEELNARPGGIAPVAFHLRHIVRSADRLLTYADARSLAPGQIAAMKSELDAGAIARELFAEFRAGLEKAAARVCAFDPAQFDEPRKVGKQQLPTTVGSLLIHVADHTQRHVGQAITTAKIVAAARR